MCFCAELVRKGFALGNERYTKGRILVMGRDGADFGHKIRNVAIVVLKGDVWSVRLGDGEESAHASATLKRSVDVESPNVVG